MWAATEPPVLRVLEQDVRGFWKFLDGLTDSNPRPPTTGKA
jgi:hypothetical protein